MKSKSGRLWERAIIFADCNSFFPSCEALDFPELRGQPIAVTNGLKGTTIISSSYEARTYGVKTGMRIYEAKRLCPGIIQRGSRPDRYAEISRTIMDAIVREISPETEIFSIDEAFCDVTRHQKNIATPEEMGRRLKKVVYEVSGLLCSVGVSGDKTTAKVAAKVEKKPNTFTVVPPWEAEQFLANNPVTDLCGVNTGIGNFLAQYGVYTCGDMKHLPISVLGKRFGNPGRRIWYMAQGLDPEPIIQNVPPPKSIGSGKQMPPNTTNISTIKTYCVHMAELMAKRLRGYEMEASLFFMALRGELGWYGGKYKLAQATDDGQKIKRLAYQMVREEWDGLGVFQIQITALDPHPKAHQLDMFAENTQQRDAVNALQDSINERYGEFTVAPGRLLNKSEMPKVIAPSFGKRPHF